MPTHAEMREIERIKELFPQQPSWRLEWGHVGKPCPWCRDTRRHWHDDSGWHEGAMPRPRRPVVWWRPVAPRALLKGMVNAFMLQMALIVLVLLFLFWFGGFWRS
jgi:hypothetical protein